MTAGRPVGLAWFSPDCKHFSKAKGGKPVEKRIRGLAWVVMRWIGTVRPRVVVLENVEEFVTWGPLVETANGMVPNPKQKGRTFRSFVNAMRRHGYEVDWRELRACDFGAPTIRKRLFLIARCDGRPILWPEPTHANPDSADVRSGRLLPWRTASECIDWSVPCPSIFDRPRPLADATMRRIANGVRRYVLDAADPFIVTCNHAGKGFRGQGIREPMKTLTAARDAHGLVAPVIARIGQTGGRGKYSNDARDPLTTVTTKAEHLLVAAHMTKFQENSVGQDVRQPAHTVMAGAPRFGVVAAFMAQHNTGVVGHAMTEPVSTIVGTGSTQAPVAVRLARRHDAEVAFLSHQHTSATNGGEGSPRKPAKTITAGGNHHALVRAFLVKYYGTGGNGQDLREPLHTIPTKDRFGLVAIGGVDYQIEDIGMRMLTPRELYRAQGFPESYVIAPVVGGAPLTKTAQVRMCGNSVCPPMAKAITEAIIAADCLPVTFPTVAAE